MTCPLCNDKEGTKKNTHYLTDGIIRTTLNQEGSNEREKGLYFNMSNISGSVEFNFQRATNVEKLEKGLGRETTDEEIERAKRIPFSVDDVFCPSCEDVFTEIEKKMFDNFLPKVRKVNLDGVSKLEFDEIKTIRLFFYLQIWRTSICVEHFNISETSLDKLRLFIFEHETITKEEIYKYPLAITYLQTKGKQENYTQNLVGHTNDSNPYLIFMNDFIIQFYDNHDAIKYFDFHNLNNKDNFRDFINYKEDKFVIKVIPDEQRIEFNKSVMGESKGKPLVDLCVSNFVNMYQIVFGVTPTRRVIEEYLAKIIDKNHHSITRYNMETLKRKTVDYIGELIKEKWNNIRR